MKFYLVFFALTFAFGQKVYVKDSVLKEAIAYANVNYCINDSIIGGDYTDSNGLLIISNSTFNSLQISCVGYEKEYKKKEFLDSVIYLKKKSIDLNEVIVSNKTRFETFGEIYSNNKIDIGFGKSLEIVTFIENKKNEEKIAYSLIFKVKKVKKKTAIRLHFYNKKPNKQEPFEEISSSNEIEFIEEKTTGNVEILIKENIIIPKQGLFVGIEILGIYNDKNGNLEFINDLNNSLHLYFNCKNNKYITFVRNRFKSNEWESTEYIKNTIPIFKKNEFPNASFGIKVYD